MTSAESAEYRALRKRFDGPHGDSMPAADVARFLELDRRTSDELDAAIAVHPLVRHDHSLTVGGGRWSCTCGAGEDGLGREAHMGAHHHIQTVLRA